MSSSIVFADDFSTQSYLVTTSNPQLENKILSQSRFIRRGRALVVYPQKDFSPELRQYLRPVELNQVKSYFPQPSAIAKDLTPINQLLSKLSASQLENNLKSIVSVSSRSWKSVGNNQTIDWLMAQFSQYGLAPQKECLQGICNVVAVKKGFIPNETVLVVAHFDSVGKAFAGADDNGSGAAGLLLLAQTLAAENLQRTVLFLAANAEENGMLGTYAYVRNLQQLGTLGQIKQVLNLDCIAYNQDGQNIMELETNAPFEAQAKQMANLALQYTKLHPKITIPAWGSDHVPFLENNIPAVLSIEDWENKNPCYHQACDKLDKIDWDFAMEILKLNLATIVTWAN